MSSSKGENIGFIQFFDENEQRRALNKQLYSGMRSYPRKIYNQHQADFDDNLSQPSKKRIYRPVSPSGREFVRSPSLSANE